MPARLLTRFLAFASLFRWAQAAVVPFELHLSHGEADPVGAGSRRVILINGTFVGPTLRLTQGDEAEITVRNYMREDTAVHFHGIAVRDGEPSGVEQWLTIFG